jgi:hypothetical protein
MMLRVTVIHLASKGASTIAILRKAARSIGGLRDIKMM